MSDDYCKIHNQAYLTRRCPNGDIVLTCEKCASEIISGYRDEIAQLKAGYTAVRDERAATVKRLSERVEELEKEQRPNPNCSWCHGSGTVRSSIDPCQNECPCRHEYYHTPGHHITDE